MKKAKRAKAQARIRIETRARATSATRGVQPDIELVPSVVQVKSILVPTDFSSPSEKALKYASKFADQFGADLTFFYVIEPVSTADFGTIPLMMETDKLIEGAKERLKNWVEKHLGAGAVVNMVVDIGRPYHQIVEAARRLKVDLIVIATHGHSGLAHVLLGSTTERVVRHASCPVLVVREKEQEFV